MKEFIEMLKKIKPNVDFENEEALVDDGILESLDIISIISEISTELSSQVMRSYLITSTQRSLSMSLWRI